MPEPPPARSVQTTARPSGIKAATQCVNSPLTIYSSREYRQIITDLLAILQPAAYAVRNNQGYWAGIWNDRKTAELVQTKGQPDHGEKIIAVAIVECEEPTT